MIHKCIFIVRNERESTCASCLIDARVSLSLPASTPLSIFWPGVLFGFEYDRISCAMCFRTAVACKFSPSVQLRIVSSRIHEDDNVAPRHEMCEKRVNDAEY